MIRVAIAILFAVELGAGFGTANATLESSGEESIVVDLRVEVEGSPDSVLAHLTLPDEDTITIPMLVREEGVYGVTTEIKPANYMVVFEVIGDPGAESEPVSLGELGVDFSSYGTTVPEEESTISASTRQWMWLGVALGAASLSVLAFWVLGGRDRPVTPRGSWGRPPDLTDAPDEAAGTGPEASQVETVGAAEETSTKP